MPLTINIDLSDRDLEHFNRAIELARKAAGDKSNQEIIDGAVTLLETARKSDPPAFVTERLLLLDDLIAMLRDEGWALSEEDAGHVRWALAYFLAPADAIGDHVPVLGFLDDAIMIELCARELRHEIDAYDDFCDFRQREAERRGLSPDAVGRADWLAGRREELQDRMHRRRARESGSGKGLGYGSSTGYASARRSYVATGWRPGVFKLR